MIVEDNFLLWILRLVFDMHTMSMFSFSEKLRMNLHVFSFSIIKPLLLPIMVSSRCNSSFRYLSEFSVAELILSPSYFDLLCLFHFLMPSEFEGLSKC